MSYFCTGPLFRKLEAQRDMLERERLDNRRRRGCEYRLARARDVRALRRMHAKLLAVKHLVAAPQVILAQVAEKHGFTIAEMKSVSRKRPVAYARFEAAYRMKAERGMSYYQISKVLARDDHTSILHAVRKHAAMHGLPLP